MDESQRALLRLHLTPGLGRVALFKLDHYFGNFLSVLAAPPKQLEEAGLSRKLIDKIPAANDPGYLQTRRKLEDLQVQLISFWDPNYPSLLRQIHDPPSLFYLRGTLPAKDCLAIVGSRRATTAGRQLTRELAKALATHEICVVSGLARGIDTAAHCGALDAEGATIAVLGCGIDRIYPQENGKLFHEILQKNAIISEYPPGTPRWRVTFPAVIELSAVSVAVC